MRYPFFFGLIMILVFDANAQSIWKDFQYNAPASFKTVDKSNRLVLEKFVGKQYGQLVIFPLENTSADVVGSFKAQWDFFARNAEQGVGDPETQEVETHNGWTYTFGAARGNFKGQMFAITLSSRYKDGHTYFVATVISDKQFLEDAIAFTDAVKVTDEAVLSKLQSKDSSNLKRSAITAGLGSTQFEDGWTSSYIGPYVKVTNGNLEAWVFPGNDSLDKVEVKPKQYLEDKYLSYAVDQFFQTRNIAERPWEMSGTGSDRIFEAEVKDKQTGEESFVAMRLIWSSGSVQTILAFAPTKEQMYKSVFARYSSFEDVLPYNKFVATPQILQGNWGSTETGSTGSYSMAGGFQGGRTNVRFKNEFTFNADGTYQSRQAIQRNAAVAHDGMARNYKGSFTINGETLQLTGWRKDDPGIFDCWLEAVHGGLALIMVNRKFTGQRYTLFKVK